MAKVANKKVKNQNKSNKPSTSKVSKPKRDPTEFTWDTPIPTLEKCLENCMEELIDLCEYLVPDTEQKKRIKELTYWLCVWENQLPEAKRRGMTSVPTCIIERAVLGLYDKSKSKGKKK